MLTGRAPFEGGTAVETLRRVVHDAPVPPRRLAERVPVDLETICLKCLEKEPQRRYESARALQLELERFLNDRPILARRAGWGEQGWRWMRRNPLAASLLGAVLGLMAAVAVVASVAAFRLNHSAELGRERLYRSLVSQAQASRFSGRVGRRLDSLAALTEAAALGAARTLSDQDILKLRHETIAALVLTDVRLLRQWEGLQQPNDHVAWDAHLETYAVRLENGMDVRRVADGQVLLKVRRPGDTAAMRVLSSEGRTLAVKYQSGALEVWDIAGARRLQEWRAAGTFALDMHPTDAWLATDQPDGRTPVMRHVQSGEERRFPAADRVLNWMKFSPDGKWLAATCRDSSRVRIWDMDSGEAREIDLPSENLHVAWAPDARVLGVTAHDGRVYLWDRERGQVAGVLDAHGNTAHRLAFLADGRVLATWGWDGVTRLWDLGTRREMLSLPGCEVHASSRDGTRLAYSTGLDLGLWEFEPGVELRRLTRAGMGGGGKGSSALESLEFMGDGRLLISGGEDGLDVWDPRQGRWTTHAPLGRVPHVGVHPLDGSLMVCSDRGWSRWPVRRDASENSEGVWRVGPPRTMLLGTAGRPAKALMSEDGSRALVELRGPRRGLAVNLADQRALATLEYPYEFDVALSPDGRWAATGNRQSSGARVWRVEDGGMVTALDTHGSTTVLFSPDGQWLVTGSPEAYEFWESGTWRRAHAVKRRGGGDMRGFMAFTRDGRWLAVAFSRQVVRLVNAADGRELATLESPWSEDVGAMAFSPDAGLLAVAAGADGARLWDLRRIRQQLGGMGLDWGGGRGLEADWTVNDGGVARVELDVKGGPWLMERDPAAPAGLIDLSPHYNAALTDGWHSGGRNSRNNLALLPRGIQRFNGVAFDVRGIVQLAGEFLKPEPSGFPVAVTGIRAGCKARRLHFLHATGWDEAPGKRVASYVVHYADATTEEIPLRFGEQVGNWHGADGEESPWAVSVAWSGTNALGARVRLFHLAWENPWPDQEIKRMDFVSHMTRSAPFLIAWTAEEVE